MVDGQRQVGVIVKTGVNAFYWFRWTPGAKVGAGDGTKVSKIPVPGGWKRATADGRDTFYRGSELLFTRESLGWVQGEIVAGDVLLGGAAGNP